MRADHPTRRPFRSCDAEALGVTRGALEGPRFRQIFHGVHVAADVPDSLRLRADALSLVTSPTAAFSHRTAALLRAWPVDDDGLLHLSVPDGQPRPQFVKGVRPHGRLDLADVCLHEGRRLTGPETTWLDLAADLGLVELVVVGDAALKGWTKIDRLAAALERRGHRRGAPRARRALPLLRPRVDSPMETRTRLVLVFAGLPCPETGLDAYDSWGEWIGRPDLSYPELKIAIQYEGDVHRRTKTRWRADVARNEVLEDHGWVVVKVVADDVLVYPQRLVRRVRGRIARQQAALGLG